MIPYPDLPKPNHYRIVAIDPGTDTLGVACLDVDIDTLKPTVVWGHTLKASKDADKNNAYTEVLGYRAERLRWHSINLLKILNVLQPDRIAAESPFFRRGRASAYEALVECFMMLKTTVYKYSRSLYLHRVDPVTGKGYVGVSHKGTDKEDVRGGVKKYLGDNLADNITLDMFDEHTIDAIAISNVIYRRDILNEDMPTSLLSKAKAKKSRKGGVPPRKRKRRKRRRK